MSFLNKRKNSRKASEKYFINCTDPNKTLHSFHVMNTNFQRAIISAIHEEVPTGLRHTRVVVKLMPSAYATSALKEYSIGMKLKHMYGFIRYICIVKCHDKDYTPASICTTFAEQYAEKHENLQLLVMPYFRSGSLREYKWGTHIHLLRSCLKQCVSSVFHAFMHVGFLHIDLHLSNILLKPTKKTHIDLGLDTPIQTHGFNICIMDFEHSLIDVDIENTDNIEQLFCDVDLLFSELTAADGAHLKLTGINEIKLYIAQKLQKPRASAMTTVMVRLCNMVDNIQFRT